MKKYSDVKAGSMLNISGDDDTIIKGSVGNRAMINISGNGDVKIKGSVGERATINIHGDGDVKIKGSVGDGVIIRLSGNGDLIFSTQPPENIDIHKSGSGNIKMPNHSSKSSKESKTYVGKSGNSYGNVIKNINISGVVKGTGIIAGNISGGTIIGGTTIGGMASNDATIKGIQKITSSPVGAITVDDGLITVTKNGITTLYAGQVADLIEGKLYIDNILVTDNDSRKIPSETPVTNNNNNNINIYGNSAKNNLTDESKDEERHFKRYHVKKSTVQQPEVSFSKNYSEEQNIAKVSKVEQSDDITLTSYSKNTQAYIDSWRKKPKNTDLLKDLQLTDEDEKLLENYFDPILSTVINIPVTIFGGIRYDLDTILALKQQLVPLTNEPFTKRDIVADRQGAEELEKIVQQIIKNHANKNVTTLPEAKTEDTSIWSMLGLKMGR